MQGALGILDARAVYDGPEEQVFIRVAGRDDRIYVDLGDPSWCAVEVDAGGWRIVATPPVRFRRPPGMRPLPEPARGGTIDRLGDFVNVVAAERVLLIAWLAAALRPTGPYALLVLVGEQGSAKSTLARVARLLLDPHTSPLRAEPKEPRDLMIGAVNGWVIALDNLSTMPGWLSDGICRLTTGGGFATRSLYTNDEEVFLDAMRPAILNGITDFVNRGDLIDRAVFLHLEVIPEEKRRTEGKFWQDFDAALPQLFGALLDAVAGGLRLLPQIKLSALPRLADYAIFAEAASRALGYPPEAFLKAYRDNRLAANESLVEDSPVAGAVRELASRGKWTGTAGELLEELRGIIEPPESAWDRPKDKAGGARSASVLPKNPRGMSGTLRRLAPALRAVGVEVTFARDGSAARRRIITISERSESGGDRPSEPSEPSEAAATDCDPNGCSSDGRGPGRAATVRDRPNGPAPALGSDGRPSENCPIVRGPSESQAHSSHQVMAPSDGPDGSDGRFPAFSAETVPEPDSWSEEGTWTA
jgi:hypothetical protein